MVRIGLAKAAAAVADNTGNTKKTRRGLREEVQTIIDLQDPCHLLHNTIKDIAALDYFKEVHASLLATTAFEHRLKFWQRLSPPCSGL
jgi:hypothetical protein